MVMLIVLIGMMFYLVMQRHLLYRMLLVNNGYNFRRLFGDNHWWFLHDNDPKRTSGLVQIWLFNNGIQLIDVPPYHQILIQLKIYGQT
jgi:hypothetical protein